MYKDFKKNETLDTGFTSGNSLLWMFSGIVLGLLVGLGMYFFSNDKISKVSMIDSLEKKIQKAQTEKPIKKETASKEQKNIHKALSKRNTQETEERRNKFSYYAVLPNLDVPVNSAKPINTSAVAASTAKPMNNTEEQIAEPIANTEVELIDEPEATPQIGDYLLQVASFKKQSMANKTRGRLSNKGIDAYVQKKKIKGRDWYRVVAGPVDKNSVDDWKSTAEQLGHKPLVISVR